jgi:hypothetical protein
MHNISNSTSDKFCCDSNQINVLIMAGILGIILLIVGLFWLCRDIFKRQPNRSMYQVLI